MSIDLNEIKQVYAEADCIYTNEQVETALERMAGEISARLKDANPQIYTIMNGGLVTGGKLLTHLEFPLQAGYMHATRYRDEISGGKLDWLVRPTHSMEGRTILVVDDILDEGHTLVEVVEHCRSLGASEVLTAVLIDKLHERKAIPGMKPDFAALEIEDRYIFGYGLDYKGYWRNAPGIFALKGH
ncbi:hypoxanthine-guanine phosphoribosyltransferase [Aestuariirhabdus sp. LZHN29]|uniref:hypoxanthine-guanine phosphoribosyltransferase n=1 Tax=Aestuariirhabdus sp. LZHN29 TaxID=3417462 RepID=UPI003CF005C9